MTESLIGPEANGRALVINATVPAPASHLIVHPLDPRPALVLVENCRLSNLPGDHGAGRIGEVTGPVAYDDALRRVLV